MIIKSIHEYGIKHVPYVSEDGKRAMLVMDADNDSHWYAQRNGFNQCSEEEYWYVAIMEEREETLRKNIADAVRRNQNDRTIETEIK